MNYAAIFHRPMSEYAHAVDASTYVFRLRAAKRDIKRCTFHYADRADMRPQLSFASVEMPCVRRDAVYDWFEFTLHIGIPRIAYYFELSDGVDTIYYLGDCFERSPDQNRSDFFQFPFNLRADRLQIPAWVSEAVVYNIFPDSFASGYRAISQKSSCVRYRGETSSSLLGGTIGGIRENLDYILELGCNCIYLNPVFVSASYHKYDTLDYFHIDPNRGTDEEFRDLVQKAHGMGIRVIVDGVFNHISWRHPFFQDVLEKGRKSPYFDWFYDLPDHPSYPEHGDAADYLCFAYVPEMPKTNTANAELRKYFCKVGQYWIREFDVDGWRLDVANEMDDGFLRAFRDAVKTAKPEALVIGEVWENAAHYLNGNMLDSAMNYDFRRFCSQFFAARCISAEEFDLRVSCLLMRYYKQAIPAQLNLLDSHDVSRFLTLCGGDRDRMELAVVFQMTFPGMPSVFYGDEKGLEGKEEPEYRRAMDFDRRDPLEAVYRKLISLRRNHHALKYGEFITLKAKGGLYVFQRKTAGETATIYLNSGSGAESVSASDLPLLHKNFENGLLKENGYIIVVSKEPT